MPVPSLHVFWVIRERTIPLHAAITLARMMCGKQSKFAEIADITAALGPLTLSQNVRQSFAEVRQNAPQMPQMQHKMNPVKEMPSAEIC